jgi:hypothetical protein
MADPTPERVLHHNSGTVAYVIKHKTDGLFWSQYGWTHAIDRALRFPLEGDAKYLADRDANLKDRAAVTPHAFSDDVRDPTAATDYDPFHIRA